MEQWFIPAELDDDLRCGTLTSGQRVESLACAWEYVRSTVPHFSNWKRLLAFVRLTAIAVVAEYRGDLVDIADPRQQVLGYDVDALLEELFGGTPVHEEMSREFRSCVLIVAEKSRTQRNTTLFRRLVEALAYSPDNYFRIRECDAMLRFYYAAALACNDIDDAWPTEEEFQALARLSLTMYEAVAYHKHRAEGEVMNVFAYAGASLRQEAFRRCREVLWSLDTGWCQDPRRRCLISMTRNFGGPIHLMMRRYRFVEDSLMLGTAETPSVVDEARRNTKLWYRVDAVQQSDSIADDRYETLMAQEKRILFSGLADRLNHPQEAGCADCQRRAAYGARAIGEFGGVRLCARCRARWGEYLLSLPEHARTVLPLAAPVALGQVTG